MLQYAQHVRSDGVFVGLADLALLSLARGKDMQVVYHDNENVGLPVARPLFGILNSLLEGFDGAPKFKADIPDPNCPSTWIIACCRADFKRGHFQSLNHFVPVYPKVQLGDCWDKYSASLKDPVEGHCLKMEGFLAL